MTDRRPTPADIKMRDEVYDAIVPQWDALGRKQPRPMGHVIFNAAVGLVGPAIEVPGQFWVQDINEEGYTCAKVACPCDEVPFVEVGCLKSCKCERFYFFALDKVMVFNSPRPRDPEPSSVESDAPSS